MLTEIAKVKKEIKVTGILNHDIYLSTSNHKLQPTKEIAFLIWSLPSKITCPYRTAHCEAECYAVKAEIQYPDCLPCRYRNLEETKKVSFVEDMTKRILSYYKNNRKPTLIVRIHESGDFYNKEYANKWLAIMDNCKHIKGIKFIAYTKSFKFFDGVKLPKNFSLRASIWDDTAPEQLEIVKRNNWNIYTAVEKFETGDQFTRCRCADCATCGKCWQNYKDIRCEIH